MSNSGVLIRWMRLLPQLLLLSWILSIRCIHASLYVTISPGEEECFRIRVPRHEHCILSGNFDLIDDAASANPVAARVESDEKVLWSSQPGDREGVFELHLMEDLSSTSGERLHRFCLENGKHFPQEDSLDRTIGWAIRVRPVPRALDEDHAGPDSERALQLAEWASELQEEWMILLDHYNFLKTREGLYGELSDHLLGRVMRWTLFEAVVLVIIATGQVLYFRKFMERRRYL